MKNLGLLLKQIEEGIQDPSFDREKDILPLINEFVTEMSQLFRLPALQAQSQVTVFPGMDSSMIDLPKDYGQSLFQVFNRAARREVSVRANTKALERLYDGMPDGGFVRDVAVAGNRMAFRPIPAQTMVQQNLDLHYYRKPVLIEDVSDEEAELDGIPEHLAQVAVDFVLWRLFALVEDGIQGQPVNTNRYAKEYQIGLLKFQEYCKNSPKAAPVVARKAVWF